MKNIFTFFFLLIITLNVTLPLVERLQTGDLYELAKVGSDNADEEGNPEKDKEKEKEKEKESLAFSDHAALNRDVLNLKKFKKSLFAKNDFPVSELYASLPERPPEV